MKNLFKQLAILVVSLTLLFILPTISHAEDYTSYEFLCPENSPFCDSANPNVSAESTAIKVMQIVAGMLLYIAAPIAVIAIIISGISMIINSDNADKVGEGKQSLLWAVIGLGVIILSYSIVQIVINLSYRVGTAG